jgi:hypothetical protein
MHLKEAWCEGVDWIENSVCGSLAVFREHGNEPSAAIK